MRAAALLLLAGLAGCTLGDDRVSRRCDRNIDCFQAQGEICNLDTHQCEQRPDAGTAATALEEMIDEAAPVEEAHHAD